MNEHNEPLFSVSVSGAALDINEIMFNFSKDSAIASLPIVDLRFSPFVVWRDDVRLDEPFSVDKLFTSKPILTVMQKRAFEKAGIMRGFMVEEYAYALNIWLAIVGHYGFDANYSPKFLKIAEPVILMIGDCAYREGMFSTYEEVRFFNGREIDYLEWQQMFFNFVTKHYLAKLDDRIYTNPQ